MEDVFYDTLAALSKVGNETERDQLAMDLFGKSADSLAGIVDDGGAALKEYGQQAEELGVIMSQDTIDSLNDVNDTIDQLKANMGGTLAQIGADVATVLAPALEKLAVVVGNVTEALRNLSPEQTAVILAITGIVTVLAPILITIGKLITAIGAIQVALAPLIPAIAAFGAAFGGPILAIGAAIAIGVALYKNWDTICAKAAELKDKVVAKFNEIKAQLTQVVDNIKTNIQQRWESIKTTITNAASNVLTTVQTKFNAVKQAIIKPIEDAKSKVQSGINAIKNIINNVKLQLPHFKLPHFKISGGQAPWGLGGQGTKPSISVDWYKKAYENPIMFTKPTVLETAGGLKGFGDGSGAEIVMSLNKLRDVVGAAGDTYITVNAAPGMDVRQLADEVARRMTQAQRQRSAVYA